jgi:hypothetical protein
MWLQSRHLPKGLEGRSTSCADRVLGLPRARCKGLHNKGSWFLQPVKMRLPKRMALRTIDLSFRFLETGRRLRLDCVPGWTETSVQLPIYGPTAPILATFSQPLRYRSQLPTTLSGTPPWEKWCLSQSILLRRTGRGVTSSRCARRWLTPGATHMC